MKGADAKDRIVLFNVPYNGYSETVTYRTGGARSAAQYGAVAVLVRSVGPLGLRTTHTGSVTLRAGTAADSGGRGLDRRRQPHRASDRRAAARCGCV